MKQQVFQADQPIDNIRGILESDFAKAKKNTLLKYRYFGYFTSENTFEIRSQWQLYIGSKPYKGKPYIKGILNPINEHTTEIEINRKNRVINLRLIFFIIFPIILIIWGVKLDLDPFILGTGIGLLVFVFAANGISSRLLNNQFFSHFKKELNGTLQQKTGQ